MWFYLVRLIFLPVLIILFALAQKNRTPDRNNVQYSKAPQWWAKTEEAWLDANQQSALFKIKMGFILTLIGLGCYYWNIQYGFWIVAGLSLIGIFLSQWLTIQYMEKTYDQNGQKK